MNLRPQCLNVVFKGGVHPLERLHRVLVSSELFRKLLVLVQDAAQDLLDVVVELMQLVGSRQDLRASVDQLQKIRPGLVKPVLPLGDGRSVSVAGVDELVGHPVYTVHTFLTDVPGVAGELTETFLQHLREREQINSGITKNVLLFNKG